MSAPRVVLAVCCLSLFLVTMDATIVNVALPAIHTGLEASLAGVQWAVDGYNVAMASIILLAGSLADRYGRRRLFQIGLAIFGIASLACAVAPSIGALIAFRIVQGMGGSMLTPSAMGIIVNTFADQRERAKAIGMWGAMTGLSFAAGPLVGGLITQTLGWRWIFAINVPIIVVAIVLTVLLIPESRALHARRLDPVGQLLAIATLGLAVWGLIDGREAHWSGMSIPALIVAALALVVLVLYELRHPEPLLELHLFRRLPFASASTVAVLSFMAFNAFLFVSIFFLQGTRTLSPFEAALYLLPTAFMIMICAPISSRLAGSGHAATLFIVAGCALTAGSLLLFGLSRDTSTIQILAAFTFFGGALGMANAAITNSAVAGMPREQAGVAIGIASAFRIVGASLGVAVAGTPALFSWWVPLACALGIIAVGFALLRAPAGSWQQVPTPR